MQALGWLFHLGANMSGGLLSERLLPRGRAADQRLGRNGSVSSFVGVFTSRTTNTTDRLPIASRLHRGGVSDDRRYVVFTKAFRLHVCDLETGSSRGTVHPSRDNKISVGAFG